MFVGFIYGYNNVQEPNMYGIAPKKVKCGIEMSPFPWVTGSTRRGVLGSWDPIESNLVLNKQHELNFLTSWWHICFLNLILQLNLMFFFLLSFHTPVFWNSKSHLLLSEVWTPGLWDNSSQSVSWGPGVFFVEEVVAGEMGSSLVDFVNTMFTTFFLIQEMKWEWQLSETGTRNEIGMNVVRIWIVCQHRNII